MHSLYAYNTFDDKVLRSDGTSLVETADVHTASRRDAEWLSTEDSYVHPSDHVPRIDEHTHRTWTTPPATH